MVIEGALGLIDWTAVGKPVGRLKGQCEGCRVDGKVAGSMGRLYGRWKGCRVGGKVVGSVGRL